MATANPIEDEISCSVCLEVFKNPHVLKECLHSFCLECIQLLEQGGRVRCPECRTFTNAVDVKQDFKTQSFIDAYKAQQQMSRHTLTSDVTDDGDLVAEGGACTNTAREESSVCGMCNNHNKPPTHKCIDCDNLLCTECEQGHQRIKACQSHKVVTVAEIMKASKEQFKQTVVELEQEKAGYSRESDKIAQHMIVARQAEKEQLHALKQYTQDAIEKLKENETRLEEVIKNGNIGHLDKLEEKQEHVNKAKDEIQQKIDFLNDTIQADDVLTLTENADRVNQSVKLEIKRLKSSVPAALSMVDVPVSVKQNGDWTVEDCIEVTVKETIHVCMDVTPEMQPDCSDIHDITFIQGLSQELDRSPYVLCSVNDEIWCAGNYRIAIYNRVCQLVGKIAMQSIRGIRGLVYIRNNQEVIVACKNRGIHQLDTRGQYQVRLAEGSFSDVCLDINYLYALEFRNNNIMVFIYSNSRWSLNKVIKFHYSNNYKGTDYDRIAVYAGNIYLSSWSSRCIYHYKADGQLIGTIKLESPCELLLCDMDKDGKLLIIDYTNSSLLVYDVTKSRWNAVQIRSSITHPYHAILDNTGNVWMTEMWSLFSKGRILKFIVKQN